MTVKPPPIIFDDRVHLRKQVHFWRLCGPPAACGPPAIVCGPPSAARAAARLWRACGPPAIHIPCACTLRAALPCVRLSAIAAARACHGALASVASARLPLVARACCRAPIVSPVPSLACPMGIHSALVARRLSRLPACLRSCRACNPLRRAILRRACRLRSCGARLRSCGAPSHGEGHLVACPPVCNP